MKKLKNSKQEMMKFFLVIERKYIKGESINFYPKAEGGYYIITLDGGLPSSFVYSNGTPFSFPIPFDEKRDCYNPMAFSGSRHYIHAKIASIDEIKIRKNLCLNPLDHHTNSSLFPHSYANVETRGESVFASRNAIDGIIANSNHGLLALY